MSNHLLPQKTLFYNCKIYSDGIINSWMLINGNKIESVGNDNKLPNHFDLKFDLKGKTVLPGLMDGHIHVFGTGLWEYNLKLDKPKSIAEMQVKLEKYAENLKDDNEWIIGFNWDQDYMEDRRYPNRYDIDQIVSDRPVLLRRGCGHISLVNSKALEILKIDKTTKNPIGGEIDHDENGEPTGILREKAQALASPYLDIKDFELRKAIIKLGLEKCISSGLTTVQTNDSEAWDIYNKLVEEDDLPIRVYLTQYFNEIEKGTISTPKNRNGMLYTDRVKIIADGSLGAQTAALKEPYADTGKVGITIQTQEELTNKVIKAKKIGYRLEIHGIGDLAAEYILNSFEKAKISKEERPILTHGQVLSKELIMKIKSLEVIVNIQPSFVTTDSQWVEQRLGKSRLKYSYAWKTLIENGINVAGGSDSPIEDPNPLKGMYAAIFRKNPKGESWRPEERLNFNEAIDLYTKGTAYSIYEENRLGKIQRNFIADFIIVDKDVIDKPELLNETRVEQVWIDGIKRFDYENEEK